MKHTRNIEVLSRYKFFKFVIPLHFPEERLLFKANEIEIIFPIYQKQDYIDFDKISLIREIKKPAQYIIELK